MSANKKPATKLEEVTGQKLMTGVAYSIEASKDHGFNNFRILTLFIKDGVIIHVEKSQGYATFEALARVEIYLSHSIWNLSSRFRHGLVQSLGGEERDALINKLKKTNPKLLEKLMPVIQNEEQKK